MIFLIGSEGSMGKRYQAIFKHLDYKYIPYDIDTNNWDDIHKCSHVLVASPTDTHKYLLESIIPLDKDVLCEKPICKSSLQVQKIVNLCKKHNSKFNMVFQYQELISEGESTHGLTMYDYFRTGNDGLYWDCLQIIALASTKVELDNKSPYWECYIDGEQLDISSMDHAYINFVHKWMTGKLNQDHQWLIDIHKKVEDYIDATKSK